MRTLNWTFYFVKVLKISLSGSFDFWIWRLLNCHLLLLLLFVVVVVIKRTKTLCKISVWHMTSLEIAQFQIMFIYFDCCEMNWSGLTWLQRNRYILSPLSISISICSLMGHCMIVALYAIVTNEWMVCWTKNELNVCVRAHIYYLFGH